MKPLPEWTTLDELAKWVTHPSQMLVLNTFRESPLLNAMRFRNKPGQAGEPYMRTTSLPKAQARALNQEFKATRGSSSRQFEALSIYGSEFREDDAAVQMGMGSRSRQLIEHALGTRLLVGYHLIYGDPIESELQLSGLQYWAENSGYSDTSISAGSDSGGAPLSRKLFRDAQDVCRGRTHIVCGEEMRNILEADVEARVTYRDLQVASRQVQLMYYNNIPVIPMERDAEEARILGFNEAAATGPATATSLYIIAHHDRGAYPFQNGLLDTFSLAKTGSQNRERLQWLVGFVGVDPFSIVRVKHIKNAPMVA